MYSTIPFVCGRTVHVHMMYKHVCVHCMCVSVSMWVYPGIGV